MSVLSKSTGKSGPSSIAGGGKRSASSRSGAPAKTKSESTGTRKQIVRYSLEEFASLPDQSDLARIAAATPEEIEADGRDDPDWEGLHDIDWSTAEFVLPLAKQAISIRLDRDVLDFFKAAGSGYQSRINAVLRAYMNAARDTSLRSSGRGGAPRKGSTRRKGSPSPA